MFFLSLGNQPSCCASALRTTFPRSILQLPEGGMEITRGRHSACKRSRCSATGGYACYTASKRVKMWLALFAICNFKGTTASGHDSLISAESCDGTKMYAFPVEMECPSARLDWSAYIGELYETRILVFSEGVDSVARKARALLRLSTATLSTTLECPVAVAATCYALAEALAIDEKTLSSALAFLHLALTFLPRAAHHECSQWPLQGRDVVAAFLELAPRVAGPRNTFHFSRDIVLDHAGSSVGTGRSLVQDLRIAVVTVCAPHRHGANTKAFAAENRRLYTSHHGYDVHMYLDPGQLVGAHIGGQNLTATNAPAFWRAYAAERVMESGIDYDWMLWLDCDALIVDLGRSVQTVLARILSDVPVVSQESPCLIVGIDSLGIRADAWLLRISPWAREFLLRWTDIWRFPAIDVVGYATFSERVAMQHAVLLPRGVFVQSDHPVWWEHLQWPREVRVVAPGEFGVQRYSPGGHHAQSEVRSQADVFAWSDPSCSKLEVQRASAHSGRRAPLSRDEFVKEAERCEREQGRARVMYLQQWTQLSGSNPGNSRFVDL
eukprot:TRINITY_DN20187_c0_g1_i1.p1 TRINITY_DN20187_c0_g1~~TRINITY_DN20187_c0_g1_i1.p1  ORF type:complete len:553 (+),score=64.28 TRINITY_DN20187_c0_g1_i1:271-1929(+)